MKYNCYLKDACLRFKCRMQASFLCLNITVRRVLNKRRTRRRKMAQKAIILFSAPFYF